MKRRWWIDRFSLLPHFPHRGAAVHVLGVSVTLEFDKAEYGDSWMADITLGRRVRLSIRGKQNLPKEV